MLDYHILDGNTIAELIDSPFAQAIGREHSERIRKQIESYEYYEGKQYELDGRMVYPNELPRPPHLDYDPTRFYTNYFKSFIQKKARWQMSGKHSIRVPAKQVDSVEMRTAVGYEPSPEQLYENERAAKVEELLYQLWDENRMREKLLQAARDRLIAGRVAVKIVFNPRNGKMRWVFRPDYEVIPVYSADDLEELEAVHFVKQFTDGDGIEKIEKQSFYLVYDENGKAECFVEEGIYTYNLELERTTLEYQSMGIDFIPVEFIPIQDLVGSDVTNDEIRDMKQLTGVINTLNEDSIDALKFEMFPITAFTGVPEGTTDNVNISPGATVEISAADSIAGGGEKADVFKVESGFTWSTAFKETYDRLKGALHEITSIPNIIPSEMNFGGMNAEAMQLVFHSIITETEEHWLIWGERLASLHAKTLKYMQARTDRRVFAYDRAVVAMIGDNYETKMEFALPLPDNRAALVELLTLETGAGFESQAGAMDRLGVQDVAQKQSEIESERQRRTTSQSPYSGLETSFRRRTPVTQQNAAGEPLGGSGGALDGGQGILPTNDEQ